MLVNLVDTKQIGKPHKKFNFNIGDRKWWIGGECTTPLVPSHCSLVTQDYREASLRKLQKLFESIWLAIATSKHLSYPSFYFIINQQNVSPLQ